MISTDIGKRLFNGCSIVFEVAEILVIPPVIFTNDLVSLSVGSDTIPLAFLAINFLFGSYYFNLRVLGKCKDFQFLCLSAEQTFSL